MGYIVPSAWVASAYDNKLRRFIIEETKIENIVITPKQTFKDATVETCILILSNDIPGKSFEVERWDLEDQKKYFVSTKDIKQENAYSFPIYVDNENLKVIQKIKKQKFVFNDFAAIVWGVKIYENGKGIPPQKGDESRTKVFHSNIRKTKSHRPLLGGSEIDRYLLKWKGGFIDYGKWLAAPRKPHWFEGERILVREVTSKGKIQATYVSDDFVFSNSVDGIKLKSKEINIKYLLGLINSKLITFYHLNTSPNAFKGTFPKVLLQDIRELPLAIPDNNLHIEIIKLVDQLLTMNIERVEAKLQTKISQIESKIDYCEIRINEIVYELYGLTEDEIKIVEGE